MALNAAAQKIQQKKPGPSCGFGVILARITEEDYKFFEEMVDAGRTGTFIADVFQEDGHMVSEFTVRRHLNGKCKCP